MRKILVKILILFNVTLNLGVAPAHAKFSLDPSITQVKSKDSSIVYYLDHSRGLRKSYNNPEAFLSYGNKFSDIEIINKSELDKWPDARLITAAHTQGVYYILGRKKGLIRSEAEFNKYGFKWSDIIEVSKIDFDSYQVVDLDALVPKPKVLGVKIKKEKKAEVSEQPSRDLQINLDATSPETYTLPINSQNNLIAVYKISAGSEEAQIKNLEIKFKGVFNQNILKKARLRNEETREYYREASPSKNIARFNLHSNPIIIPANETQKIGVYIDFDSDSDVTHQSLWASIESDTAIELDRSLDKENNFPIEGNVIKLISALDHLGQVEIQEEALGSADWNIGTEEELLARFKVAEISKEQAVLFQELILENLGSARDGDIVNFKLKNDRHKLIAQANTFRDRKIIFDIANYRLDKKDTDYFYIYGDIVGEEGKTVNLDIDFSSARGEDYVFNVPVNINNISESLNITREKIKVYAQDLEANTKVFSEETGSIIGRFSIRNNNQNLFLENLKINLSKNQSAPQLDNTVYLVNYDTGEVIDYLDLLADQVDEVNLEGRELSAKDDLDLAFITEIPNDAVSGDVYRIQLNSIEYSRDNDTYTDELDVSGQQFSVSRSNIYIANEHSLEDLSISRGEKKAKIASFILSSSLDADIRIESLSLALANNSGSLTYTNGFSNLSIYLGGKKRSIAKPFGNTYLFEDINYKLCKGSSKELKVYVDVDPNSRITATQLKISNIVASDYKTGVKTDINNDNLLSPAVSFGDVVAEVEILNGGGVLKGRESNLIASFRLKNTGVEDIRLKEFNIGRFNSGYRNLVIVDRVSGKRIEKIRNVDFGSNQAKLSKKIKVNEEFVFDIYLDAAESVSGDFTLFLSDFLAVGLDSRVEADFVGDPTSSVNVVVN